MADYTIAFSGLNSKLQDELLTFRQDTDDEPARVAAEGGASFEPLGSLQLHDARGLQYAQVSRVARGACA